jgi:hypothetical protein
VLARKYFAILSFAFLLGAGFPSRSFSAPRTAAASKGLQAKFCANLFRKEWVTAIGEMGEPIPSNGFKFGIGTRMSISVDGHRGVEGIFLGRSVDMNYETTNYFFEDYVGGHKFMIDAKRTKLYYNSREIKEKDLQAIAESLEQRGEVCATYAVENHLTQMLVAKIEGNGELRKAFDTKTGHADVRQMANEYYLKNKGGANFKPIYKEISEKFGFTCKSLEATTSAQFEKIVSELVEKGTPVLLEFYIPGKMVLSDKPWVNSNTLAGEDSRFWPPNAKGQRKVSGHALVAVESFVSASGRLKFLVNDSDWPERPVEWDYNKYFKKRAKSSGMLAHYCIDKKVKK